MMKGFTGRIRDGKIEFLGMEHPPASVEHENRAKGVLVVKVAGGTHWAGIGLPRGRTQARYCAMTGAFHGDSFCVGDIVAQWPVRKAPLT